MGKMHIVHLIPSLFPYGAYALLSEIHYGIQSNHLNDCSQEVVALKGVQAPARWEIPFSFQQTEGLNRYLRGNSNSVVLFYKLAGTDCKPVQSAISEASPFIIINVSDVGMSGIGKCDGLVTVSQRMFSNYSVAYKNLKVHLIKNGVHAARFVPYTVRTEDFNSEDYFVTGRMNNFNRCKHPKDWVKWCLRSVRLSKPMWHDYLGWGGYHKDAVSQAEKHKALSGGNVVNLPGVINSRSEKAGYIKRWSAFLYEIRGVEGISMSLLEALACGVPAIINNKPGNNEIIKNGINGWVCNSREEMYSKMKLLSSNPKLLDDMKNSVRSHFKANLDGAKMVKQYIELCKQVNARRNG